MEDLDRERPERDMKKEKESRGLRFAIIEAFLSLPPGKANSEDASQYSWQEIFS